MNPWMVRALLIDVDGVARGLAEIEEARARGLLSSAVNRALPSVLPTPPQVARYVQRMWQRLLFASDDVGTSAMPVRPGWRARLLDHRALRLPFLLKYGSVVPLDLSGLRSSTSTLRRHLLGTHHERLQAVYDLELLAARDPPALQLLRDECAAVVEQRHEDAELLRDLCVYERYHEQLLALIDAALAGNFLADEDADDVDLSFFAMLRFCARAASSPVFA
ncbi:MAG: hypothetical protein Q8O67_31155 [Deltaproteobacteria bacterium]|nr:hypothetical protein [Deltaproteobacteria bacterium]